MRDVLLELAEEEDDGFEGLGGHWCGGKGRAGGGEQEESGCGKVEVVRLYVLAEEWLDGMAGSLRSSVGGVGW